MKRNNLAVKCKHRNKEEQAFFVIYEIARLYCVLVSIITLGYYTSYIHESLLFGYDDGHEFFTALRTKFKIKTNP